MATTRYVVAATPSNKEKVISNLKAARTEADVRARLDRVDVTVTTQATGKLSYTAKGAITAPAAEPTPVSVDETPETPEVPEVPEQDAPEAPADDEDTEPAADDSEDGADEDGEGDFDAVLADVLSGGGDENTEDTEDEDGDDNGGHRGQADCGCSVEVIVETGEHQKGCTELAAEQAKVAEIEAAKPRPRRASTGTGRGGGRRESQGQAAVDGWELLYDKPKQQAQVGRREGKYALICTTHKTAHPLGRLVQERALRQGPRSAWCTECTA